MQSTSPVTRTADSILTTNRVLRNTYALLAATLLFSAVMAAVSMAIAPPRIMAMGASIVGIVFLCTGLLGFGLGPMLSFYAGLPNGGTIISTAMGGTGVIFLALSAYVLTTKKSFDFMGGMLFVGLLVVFGAILVNLFIQIPALSMAISGAMVLLMSGFILFDTGRIVNGGETNYIRATVSMFINIFNLFTSLLHLLGIMSDE